MTRKHNAAEDLRDQTPPGSLSFCRRSFRTIGISELTTLLQSKSSAESRNIASDGCIHSGNHPQ